ncbi:DUF2771 family protein [Allokutzneria oryzae]|uniref:DUF2771 family protein n=1 Tax=Allokutzneria oryzae TaxID=1378989 RepID=A0ABV6A6X3_9PSEU
MRRGLALLLAAAGATLAGCAAPTPPNVTFYAAGKTAVTGPAQHCDVLVENCTADTEAHAVLRVPPGKPLQISVDSHIGETPWQVVFRYRDAAGTPIEGRSAVFFGESQRLAYTLRLPTDTAQLETVEIQQFGGVLAARQDGGVDFVTRGTWVLSVDDRR